MQNNDIQMKGFVDIHHHLIYGLDDDGPQNFQETCAMLKAAQADGIVKIIATPHVIPGIQPFPMDVYLSRIEEAREYCQHEGIQIEILIGAEILYTQMTTRYLNDKKIPTLASTSYVLVEFPAAVSYAMLVDALWELIQNGYKPILAHAERYKCLLFRPRRTILLRKKLGVSLQINCATLQKRGFASQRFYSRLFKMGAVDWVATDAHNIMNRRVAMKTAFGLVAKRYGKEYAVGFFGLFGERF